MDAPAPAAAVVAWKLISDYYYFFWLSFGGIMSVGRFIKFLRFVSISSKSPEILNYS